MSTSDSTKSRSVALIACVLGGFFGLHRFYVGRWKTGILLLLLNLAHGLGLLWWLIDFVRVLSGRFPDGEGRRITRW